MSAVRTAVLPPYVQEILASCPAAGGGVHQWLFKAALVLHRHLSAPEIVAALEQAVAGCGRAVDAQEIEDAVRNSFPVARRTDGPREFGRWPKPNLEQIEALVRGGIGLVDLWERSPIRVEESLSPERYIDLLFPGNPLLCCGKSKTEAGTGTREEWRGHLRDMQFIVPSPMSAEQGHRKEDGALAVRCLDNTGPRRFLVVECDFSERSRDGSKETVVAPLIRALAADGISVADMCAAVLWHLARYGPLVMVVHSGGKSLHGWFHCEGQPEEHLLKFMRLAVSLGADSATWSRCQFVRLTGSAEDGPGVEKYVRSKDPRRKLANRFKDEALL